MINKTQAKILRALPPGARAFDYREIQKATGLMNPIGYLSDLIAFGLVSVTTSTAWVGNRYQITGDGLAVIRVYDRIEAHKARFAE